MPDVTAGDVVTAAIRDLVEQFRATEPAALTDEVDGVHQHRTQVRRLRNALHAFRDFLDPFLARQLRGSLREWGSALGVVRDHEVAADLVAALLADLGAESADGRIMARLVDPERAAALVAHHRVVQIHDLERMRQMRQLLRELADDPPLTAAAAAPADSIRLMITHQAEHVLRKAKHLPRSEESQHQLRKRARRLRHAIDAAMTDPPGVFDEQMHAIAAAAHRIQSSLGDHRDALFVATRIDRAQVLAGRAGEDTRPYDELGARSRAFADESLRRFRRARKKLAAALEAERQ